MNQDQLEGKWKQLKGRAKEKWGELTDDDLDEIQASATVFKNTVWHFVRIEE